MNTDIHLVSKAYFSLPTLFYNDTKIQQQIHKHSSYSENTVMVLLTNLLYFLTSASFVQLSSL